MPLARGGRPVRRTFTGTASRRLLPGPPRTFPDKRRSSTITLVPRLQRKSFAKPDHVRELGTGRLEVVDLDEASVGYVSLPAGWRWRTDVQPVVGTPSCDVRHVAYAISGRLHVVMDD